jgi:hypothetical protein
MKLEILDSHEIVHCTFYVAINIVGDLSTRLDPADVALSGNQVKFKKN